MSSARTHARSKEHARRRVAHISTAASPSSHPVRCSGDGAAKSCGQRVPDAQMSKRQSTTTRSADSSAATTPTTVFALKAGEWGTSVTTTLASARPTSNGCASPLTTGAGASTYRAQQGRAPATGSAPSRARSVFPWQQLPQRACAAPFSEQLGHPDAPNRDRTTSPLLQTHAATGRAAKNTRGTRAHAIAFRAAVGEWWITDVNASGTWDRLAINRMPAAASEQIAVCNSCHQHSARISSFGKDRLSGPAKAEFCRPRNRKTRKGLRAEASAGFRRAARHGGPCRRARRFRENSEVT